MRNNSHTSGTSSQNSWPKYVRCCSLQLSTLCDPMDSSPPGSSVQGILQQEHWSGLPLPLRMYSYCQTMIAHWHHFVRYDGVRNKTFH